MKKVIIILILFICIGCEYDKPKISLGINKAKKTKNIIIMIADGCGFNHIEATNYFINGELSSQVYEQFPVFFPVCSSPAVSGDFLSKKGLSWRNGYNSSLTYSDSLWRTYGYTGSGAAATAIFTGRKTYNGSISMDAYFKPLKSIAQKAKELGLSTGLVTSVQFSHATPAAFGAHNVDRDNYKEIAQELIKSNMDIIIGCGHPDYDEDGNKINDKEYKYVGGNAFWNQFLAGDNYGRKLLTTYEDFEYFSKNPSTNRILGIPQVHSTLQVARSGDSLAYPFVVPFTQNIPDLSMLSLASLNSLNRNEKGFVIMIEGGAVDWAAHSNYSGRMIEELNSFNITVENVVKWVEKNSNWEETLLIVTADHETGYLTGVDGFNSQIKSSGKGKLPKMKWNSNNHTNVLIPLYAKGSNSELFDDYADELDSLRGYFIQNSEIGQILFRIINN